MNNSVVCFILVLIISGCSSPRPPQVSLKGGLSPVNFNEAANDPNIIIRSEQEKKRTGENDSPTQLRAETILLNFSMPLPMPIKLLPE